MPLHCRYTRHRAQLASPYVAAQLSIRMGLAAAERCAMFAVIHGTRGCAAGMVGKMHEDLSHLFLAGGCDFDCRMIDSGKEFTLKLPKSNNYEVRWTGVTTHNDVVINKQGSFSGVTSGLVYHHIALGPPCIASQRLCSTLCR